MKFLVNLWSSLTRKKQIVVNEESKLARVLNIFELTSLGVGTTLGVSVYVLAGNVAYHQAGPSVVLSFFLAAVASTFAGLCYAEFSARAPAAGSAYMYSYVTVGEFIAFTIGWNLILEYVIGAASIARGLSGTIDELFGNKIKQFWLENFPMKISFLAEYPDLLSFGIISILTVILATGAKKSSIFQSFFTFINMMTILTIIIAGVFKASPSNWAIPKENIPEGVRGGEGGFMPYGIAGVMAGAAKCFYGFVGFDCIATASEEAKNPKRNIPLAVILTLTVSVIVYITVSTVTTMMWPYYDLSSDAPLPYIFNKLGMQQIRWIVSIGAVFALFSGLFGTLFSLPRIIYAMAKDGVIFKFLETVHPVTKTPIYAIALAGFSAAVMATIFSLHQLIDMLCLGTLMAYTIVAVCVLILRYEVHNEPPAAASRFEIGSVQNFNTNSDELPNKFSSNLTKIAVVIFILLSIALSIIVSTLTLKLKHTIFIVLILAAMVWMIFIIAQQPIDNSVEISFKVPFVPFLPCLSILCNVFLVLQLDGATWIRFGIWIFIGYSIYFLYGIKASLENKKGVRG